MSLDGVTRLNAVSKIGCKPTQSTAETTAPPTAYAKSIHTPLMSLEVSARTQTRMPKFTRPTTKPLTTTITRVVFLRSMQMAASPPSEQVSSTLSVCEVTSPVPFAVSSVIIKVSAMLAT